MANQSFLVIQLKAIGSLSTVEVEGFMCVERIEIDETRSDLKYSPHSRSLSPYLSLNRRDWRGKSVKIGVEKAFQGVID